MADPTSLGKVPFTLPTQERDRGCYSIPPVNIAVFKTYNQHFYSSPQRHDPMLFGMQPFRANPLSRQQFEKSPLRDPIT